MGREIVHIQIGQCGNQVGSNFWNTVRQEHHLSKDGKFEKSGEDAKSAEIDNVTLDKVGVYFKETGQNRYTPRALLVDLEPGTLDTVKASPIGTMFKPDNFIFGNSGAGNNWAKGHYTDGAELIDEMVDVVRRETEACDSPQGFQVVHSLGGGTGSGLGTLLVIRIRDNYPDRITCTFSVYPSKKVSDVVVEPYNATLSIHQLLENSDETFVIDNEALFNISHETLKLTHPKYDDLNWLISLVMSGITASLRFPGKLNGDLRKMGVNLVPFPRLHFFLIAQAPIFATADANKVHLSVQELVDQMWSSKNFLACIDPKEGKYLAASCAFRGDIPTQEVDDEIAKQHAKMSDEFVEWIPNNIKTSIITVPPKNSIKSATFVANTTALKSLFLRVSEQFHKMYKRKAFLHWYTNEGMDEMEFQESDKNVRDLVTEYNDKQDARADVDGAEDAPQDDEEEEEEEEEE